MDFVEYPLLLIFVVSIAAMLAACEACLRFGLSSGGLGKENTATLQASVLGLLALMIGFTFAMALSRFEARRDAVLNEANSIGTTALRARLLPAPHDIECLKLLREYVQVRLDLTGHIPSAAELRAALDRSNAIQEALWQQVKAVAAKDNSVVPTGVFIQSLNETIDNHEKRIIAASNRVPNVVLLALYGIAIVAAAFSGYSAGQAGQRSRVPVYTLAVLVAGVILIIQDLDRPNAGFIKVSQQPMIDTAASIASYTN